MICPNCGQEMPVVASATQFVTHVMNQYVNPETGAPDGAYNSEDEKLTVGEEGSKTNPRRVLVRSDKFVKKPATKPEEKK